MPPHRRLRTPTGTGDVLADPGFAAVPGLIERNRRILDTADVAIGGLPLRELRRLARQEVLESPGMAIPGLSADAPLILAGHQPELFHPGVWVKHFALNGLSRRVGGVPLNLIVDSDTMKSATIRVPTWERWEPAAVRTVEVPFDAFDQDVPYEARGVINGEVFDSFPERVARLTQAWGYKPALEFAWLHARTELTVNVGEFLTACRRVYEAEWGCSNLELPVSRLSQTTAFRLFVEHVRADMPRFREAYNAAAAAYRRANGLRSRTHPVPDLTAGELPFWGVGNSRGWRRRLTVHDRLDPAAVRPRALTLTLFARVCLGDFFVHGIGGGKYDEVTDNIIRRYFGLEPPAYQVLSATLHLPLPHFPSTEADVRRLERLERDLHWNPQRHLPTDEVGELRAEHDRLAADEPSDRRGRRRRFHELRRVTEQLRPRVEGRAEAVREEVARARREAAVNTILTRRDYAWVLYPEEVLRPFLQRFL